MCAIVDEGTFLHLLHAKQLLSWHLTQNVCKSVAGEAIQQQSLSKVSIPGSWRNFDEADDLRQLEDIKQATNWIEVRDAIKFQQAEADATPSTHPPLRARLNRGALE